MKKQILLSSTLFAAISVFPQNGRVKPIRNIETDISSKMLAKERPLASESESKMKKIATNNSAIYGPQENSKTMASAIVWNQLSGSMNIYGMLVSNSKPLQYNAKLNALSFVHRKSASYTAVPVNNSGAIIASISTDWGTSWDSTCFWSDGSNLARYPQGAIYCAPSNSSIANAYIVGSGPVTNGTNWTGNWYASKQLGTYNNTASSVPNAQQFMTTVPSNTAVGKHEFSRLHFTSTDDGYVRSIGMINGDGDANTFAAIGRRGAAIVKGSYNNGVFNWTSDSIICPAAVRTDGGKTMNGTPRMAWNTAGTVGYVVFIGSRAGAIGANKGWQPIVFKTTNSGNSWSLINGIDFNCPFYQPILTPLPAVWSYTGAPTPTVPVIPNFNEGEGIDVTVDSNNKLHILSTIVGASSPDIDSITGGYSFDVEQYSWDYTPGKQPFIYDFVGDGNGNWGYMLVDTLTSEGPSSEVGEPGYNDNNWAPDPAENNIKVTSDSRLQLSRTPSGSHIIYTWAESNPALTNSSKHWNNIPNVKARCYDVTANKLSTLDIDVTKPVSPNSPNFLVQNKAFFHYASPTTGNWQGSASTGTINVPLTVSNNNNINPDPLTNNVHWYSTAKLEFTNFNGSSVNYPTSCITTIKERSLVTKEVSIYPNPTSGSAVVAINLAVNSSVNVIVLNALGQVVKTNTIQGQIGNNDLNLDLTGLSNGVYMVNVKVGNTISIKKLIIQ